MPVFLSFCVLLIFPSPKGDLLISGFLLDRAFCLLFFAPTVFLFSVFCRSCFLPAYPKCISRCHVYVICLPGTGIRNVFWLSESDIYICITVSLYLWFLHLHLHIIYIIVYFVIYNYKFNYIMRISLVVIFENLYVSSSGFWFLLSLLTVDRSLWISLSLKLPPPQLL